MRLEKTVQFRMKLTCKKLQIMQKEKNLAVYSRYSEVIINWMW